MAQLMTRIVSALSRTWKLELAVNGSWRILRRQLQALPSSGALVYLTLTSPGANSVFERRYPVAKLSSSSTASRDGRVSITFTDRDGDKHTVRARIGDNLLEVAREYDIDLEGKFCVCACDREGEGEN